MKALVLSHVNTTTQAVGKTLPLPLPDSPFRHEWNDATAAVALVIYPFSYLTSVITRAWP